ncbi:hypothetical protein Tco_0418661 [Tanacetum coccineum]
MYKSHLPQKNNQLRTSSNARNKAMVQDGRVVVQDVRGRYNANNQGKTILRNNARGNVVDGDVGGQNRGALLFLNDLALNVDHIFEADYVMPFDSDVNVQDHDNYHDSVYEHHDVHEMQNNIQQDYVVDSEADYTCDSNIILYDQYVEDKAEHVVQSNVSSVQNDALRSIIDEIHEEGVQSRIVNKQDRVVKDSLNYELARYKELVEEYEKQAMKKVEASVLKLLSTPTMYPPNTPVKLVPRVLPTKSQVKINLYTLTQLFTEFDKTCKKRITPTGLTEGERGFEQTKRCYLTEVIPFFKTLKQHFEGVQKALFKEVKEMEEIFDQMSAEVDQNTVDKQCAEIERKNLLIANENLIANCLSNQLMFAVEQSRCLDLEAEISKLQNENQKDVNDEMIRGFNKLEVEYLNLQLKYQHLQENFRNNKSQTSQDVPEFDSFFRIKILETQLQEKDNVIRNLKAQVSKMNDRSCETYNAKDVTALIEQNECVRVELEKVKQHYKELYDSIKITRAHTSEKTSTMLNEIESLKAQVSSSTDASRSKPRSNTKKNRILPAKSENKMKVEDHPRINKSVWTKVNRVESSISSKLVVINSNSESVCKTCNKCLIYANHDMSVIKPLNSVNATPTVKNGLNKVKQVWKVKGKLSANGLNKAKQAWKATGKVFANVGYQWRPTRKKFTLGKHIGGHQ